MAHFVLCCFLLFGVFSLSLLQSIQSLFLNFGWRLSLLVIHYFCSARFCNIVKLFWTSEAESCHWIQKFITSFHLANNHLSNSRYAGLTVSRYAKWSNIGSICTTNIFARTGCIAPALYPGRRRWISSTRFGTIPREKQTLFLFYLRVVDLLLWWFVYYPTATKRASTVYIP